MNKTEGMMEKGTWKDVTKECKVELNVYGETGAWVKVSHEERYVVGLGKETCDKHSAGYRLTTLDVGDTHPGHFKIEQFIPDPKPEWVDVTDELRAKMGQTGYVSLWHGDICVATLGSRLHADSMGEANYRVTTTNAAFSGRFKVEKRND